MSRRKNTRPDPPSRLAGFLIGLTSREADSPATVADDFFLVLNQSVVKRGVPATDAQRYFAQFRIDSVGVPGQEE